MARQLRCIIGDAVMAIFGVPVVHEDDALRALRAAADMRDALPSLNRELEQTWGLRLGIRTGVDTGEVIVGDRSQGQPLAAGVAVTVAKRLQEAAAMGEVLIGEATSRLVTGAIADRARRRARLGSRRRDRCRSLSRCPSERSRASASLQIAARGPGPPARAAHECLPQHRSRPGLPPLYRPRVGGCWKVAPGLRVRRPAR